MTYWDTLLKEVLNKRNPSAFVNTDKQAKLQIMENDPLKAFSKQLHAQKSLPKKQTQIVGKIRKYKLGDKYPDIYFTKREAQVAFYFVRGMSTVQVATLLRLSRRTVEFYVNNMKVKLDCRFKSQLISTIIRSDFLKLIDFHLEIPGESPKPVESAAVAEPTGKT
jgi:DNA-binding CsgD family transcriptional regulator